MSIRKSQCVMRKLLASAAATGLAIPAHAATFYVNANFANCGTSDGTAAKPFCSIQPAVTAAASGDTVQVAAGSYMEDVDIVGKALKILGADPTTTVVQGFGNVFNAHDFAAPTKIVEIANFTVSGGGNNGVAFNNANLAGYVHNCILINNKIGIGVYYSSARVTNSVFVGSSEAGVYAYANNAFLTLYSNILINNNNGAETYFGQINSSYNSYFGNTTNRSSPYGSIGSSNDSDNSDPKFVDAAGGDFHLASASPAIDAGSPGATDKDPDGTRADQGVYGGPGSAAFLPGTSGLPVVTGLLVTPHDVAIGGTFTLTGTGKAP